MGEVSQGGWYQISGSELYAEAAKSSRANLDDDVGEKLLL